MFIKLWVPVLLSVKWRLHIGPKMVIGNLIFKLDLFWATHPPLQREPGAQPLFKYPILPNAIRRTRIIPTFQNILITVISAVVITITHPEWFHTDGCSLTASLVAWTRHISVLAHLNRLIRLICILTVINSIAELMLGDTTRVCARVFIIRAGRVWAVNLVGSITTVVFVVTLPVLEDAAAVAAPKQKIFVRWFFIFIILLTLEGRGHLNVYYNSPEFFIIMFSFSLA